MVQIAINDPVHSLENKYCSIIYVFFLFRSVAPESIFAFLKEINSLRQL